MKISAFKIDLDRIENGEWIDRIPDCDGLRLKVRGINNRDYVKMQQRMIEKIPRGRRMSRTLDPDDMFDIQAKCLLDTCLLDWDGLENSETGEPVPFSREQASLLLTNPEYRPFRDAVLWAATFVAEQDREQQDTISKN